MAPRALRALSVAVLALGLGGGALPALPSSATPAASAEGGWEQLTVPSAAMGRDIPVAFIGAGPKAVFLLDAFNAHPEVSNWMTVGNAPAQLAGTGLSVVAPAGGAYSMYTNWEKDGSKQWRTFLSSELPDWLTAHRGLAPGGHAAVGAGQGGYGAMALAAFHPDRFGYAGSMSSFLYPSATTENGRIVSGMQRFGRVEPYSMWGAPQLGRWKWHDPYVHIALLMANNTRIWVYAPSGGPFDPAAILGSPEEVAGSGHFFYSQYRYQRGQHNGHFEFPEGMPSDWSSWGPQLGVMAPDIVAAIG